MILIITKQNQKQENNECIHYGMDGIIVPKIGGRMHFEKNPPLSPEEKQMIPRGQMDATYTGYHFHNFFKNTTTLRHKYKTYGHPHPTAHKIPLSEIHGDVQISIECVLDIPTNASKQRGYIPGGLNAIVGRKPLHFTNNNGSYVAHRHEEYKQIILQTIDKNR